MTTTPTLAQLLKDAIESRLIDLHTCLPGTIVSYDSTTQFASIQPDLKRVYVDTGAVDLPVINNVPICFPRSSTASITFPLSKGDKVLLIFSERSIDIWKSSGMRLDPKDARKHALSDAFAIPCGYPKTQPISNTRDDAIQLKYLTSEVNITKTGKISIKNLATSVEYVDQVIKVLNEIMASTVATAIGLQPLIPSVNYLVEKTKLETFKE